MIYIQRSDPPEVFTKKNGPALKEKLLAEKYFSTQPPPAGKFEFKFYSTQKDKYKDILVKVFNSRCAYCECFITASARGDIEHFRPKQEYKNRDGTTIRPGYYWLASNWHNLYLSCTNCNQVSTFEILDADNPGAKIIKPAG